MPAQTGLSSHEAAALLAQVGLNEIVDKHRNGPLKILFGIIAKNFIIYLLILAGVISWFVGEHVTTYALAAVILLITIVSFIQEYRAEQAIQALKGMMTSVSIVVRDGREQEIPTQSIVPGDLIILRTGDRIPADAVIVESSNLEVNESVLTGESREVRKSATSNLGQPEEINQLYMGSFIVNGRARALVTKTGMETKFGQVANLISATEKAMPLQDKLNSLIKKMVITSVTISVMTGGIILLRTDVITPEVLSSILILVIALSVSAFPEGLPVVLVTTLAVGATRMAKHNAIVNRMSIIETLGETTIVCTDKTGTITRGEMTVKKIHTADGEIELTGTGYEVEGEFKRAGHTLDPKHHLPLWLLIKSAIICNDTNIQLAADNEEFKILGTPTEGALMVMAAKAKLKREDLKTVRVEEVPFNSSRKLMSVLVREDHVTTVYAKGAVEVLLDKCDFHQVGHKVLPLTDNERQKILLLNSNLTQHAYRTLGMAYKPSGANAQTYTEDQLIFLGLAGLEDPPREEVAPALKICHEAGIAVKMITGDHQDTAVAIAQQIGLPGQVVLGPQLDSMTDEELISRMPMIGVFARVRPEHKLRIVRLLKQQGEVVTMTGDGVNDAPALKEAHIGVAMGKNGTDVSRSVADLTLRDDDFATIVIAIREGRTIFSNIRKFVAYQLSCNWSELAVLLAGVLLAPLLGWEVPVLLALQILFMNLVIDDLTSLTLGLNRSATDVMREKPRRQAKLIDRHAAVIMTMTTILLAIFTLGAYYLSFNIFGQSTAAARTTAMLTIIILEIASAFNFRSFRFFTLTRSPLHNPQLFYFSILSLILTAAVIYIPVLAEAFEAVPLPVEDWMIAIAAGLLFILAIDWTKQIHHLLSTRRNKLN